MTAVKCSLWRMFWIHHIGVSARQDSSSVNYKSTQMIHHWNAPDVHLISGPHLLLLWVLAVAIRNLSLPATQQKVTFAVATHVCNLINKILAMMKISLRHLKILPSRLCILLHLNLDCLCTKRICLTADMFNASVECSKFAIPAFYSDTDEKRGKRISFWYLHSYA